MSVSGRKNGGIQVNGESLHTGSS